MRDKIKYIVNDYIKTGNLHNCEQIPGTGYWLLINKDDVYYNWEVTGTSLPNFNKVTYKIYNSYYPDKIIENGVLKVNTYNKYEEILKIGYLDYPNNPNHNSKLFEIIKKKIKENKDGRKQNREEDSSIKTINS